jgi:hypothetical protein
VAGERLAALYRFQNGERWPDHCPLLLIDAGDAELTDPAQIDWENFPVLAALEAVTRDELRRLRRLLRTDSAAMTTSSNASGSLYDEPTPPSHGTAWGLPVGPSSRL